MLARMGVSVSVDAINAAVLSLSAESHHAIHALVHTVSELEDTLIHLTSGLLFPLQHGITHKNLQCLEILWEKSPLNLQLNPSTNLLRLHPDSLNAAGLSHRDCFNSWKMLGDLINYGPLYFHQFKDQLGELEIVESIPVVKTPILAACAMHLSNSTVSRNISSVVELLRQGGIDDPDKIDDPDMLDISEYILLFHGDLGSGECLQAAQQRRSIEDTPWKRLQHVVFILGLFHLQMASANAIWCTFLQPLSARDDDNALMHDIAILQPRETGIYGSKPRFRQMHELITYDGICRRLDCWRVEANKDLDAYAASELLFDDLKAMADQLTQNYVANHRLQQTRSRNYSQWDEQYKNRLLLNKYFLLYEELSHWLLETCIFAWILIFKATGKHKYVTQMTDFLYNIHFTYPEGLRKAIQYNVLVNPMGKKGKFWAIDWCVELNNLFIKVINGGKSSNHTADHIILESPLVQIYQNLHKMFEWNMLHSNVTNQHAEADMSQTFKELRKYMMAHSPYELKPG
ncbi:hypothetical protein CY34DRAFT_26822 [Suillus luteus UH-Slu-Lm8-n1]|uniref:DUF6589 domain-containing protein n=1 Tax=Suillus luteus UH-Slu-Lm8-n1 TaxID=930992 RepID=A0A0D0A8W7_9AGAM|nr:hypothetical protein CY34DRAFT_26822 [Suillus luteus UH-Slu-Lm8-n1]